MGKNRKTAIYSSENNIKSPYHMSGYEFHQSTKKSSKKGAYP